MELNAFEKTLLPRQAGEPIGFSWPDGNKDGCRICMGDIVSVYVNKDKSTERNRVGIKVVSINGDAIFGEICNTHLFELGMKVSFHQIFIHRCSKP